MLQEVGDEDEEWKWTSCGGFEDVVGNVWKVQSCEGVIVGWDCDGCGGCDVDVRGSLKEMRRMCWVGTDVVLVEMLGYFSQHSEKVWGRDYSCGRV